MSTRVKRWALGVLGVIALGLAAALAYLEWPRLYPPVVARAPLDPGCDLRAGPCRVAFDQGGEVTLSIEPRDIPLVKPLRLRVGLQGLVPDGVEIDFSGLSMNMGFNRVPLAEAGPGSYVGQAMLPVCVRNRMDWEARVLLRTPAGYLEAPFRFDTYRIAPPEATPPGQ